MLKKHFYRFLSHITYGKTHDKFRAKYRGVCHNVTKLNSLDEITNKLNALEATINNINFKQNLFLDYFVDPANARPATGALAKRQAENLCLLKEFVAICKKYKLDYWLDFGTLLGAKRHGGFVPWDDDIDVAMRREDIVKFRDVFQKGHKENLEFLFWMGEQSRLVFKNDTGAFLDIYAYQEKDNELWPVPIFPISSYNSHIMHDIIYPFSQIEFCGIKFNAPKNVEAYLKTKYGNYNLLPKVTHSVGGHNSLDEYKE